MGFNFKNLNKMETQKQYIGTYKVVKFFRVSNRRQILKRGLSLEQAKTLVNSYPDSNRSLVGFTKQFTSAKYYK